MPGITMRSTRQIRQTVGPTADAPPPDLYRPNSASQFHAPRRCWKLIEGTGVCTIQVATLMVRTISLSRSEALIFCIRVRNVVVLRIFYDSTGVRCT